MIILFELVILFSSFSHVFSSTEAPKLIELVKTQRQTVGSTYALTCNTWSGSPPFKYSFYQNDVLLKSGSSSNSRVTVTEMKDSLAMLMIKNLTINDSGNYSCTVQSRHGVDAKWTVLQVNGLFLFLLCLIVHSKCGANGVSFKSLLIFCFHKPDFVV